MIIPSVYPPFGTPAETVEINQFLAETNFLNRCHIDRARNVNRALSTEVIIHISTFF